MCAPLLQDPDLDPLSDEQAGFLAPVVAFLDNRIAGNDDMHHPWMLTGGPGTGKTHVIRHFLAAASTREAPVLVASPTGLLAKSIGTRPGVLATTIHRAFLQEDIESLCGFLAQFSAWVILEIGMVTQEMWDKIYFAWAACERWPVLLVEGDFQQMPPPVPGVIADARAAPTLPWSRAFVLHRQHRCRDPGLAAFAQSIRHVQPSAHEVTTFFMDILVSRELTLTALESAWQRLPGAMVLCATRATARQVNDHAVQKDSAPELGHVSAWCDEEAGEMRRSLLLRHGTKVMVRRNLDLDTLVNGAVGCLREITPAGLLLEIDGGFEVLHARSQWVDSPAGSRLQAAYDISHAYAMTVHKAQGASLDYGIICFEKYAPPGWGYTALTRFRTREGLLCLGPVGPAHFRPRALVS